MHFLNVSVSLSLPLSPLRLGKYRGKTFQLISQFSITNAARIFHVKISNAFTHNTQFSTPPPPATHTLTPLTLSGLCCTYHTLHKQQAIRATRQQETFAKKKK